MYDGIDYRGHWVTSARGGRTAEGNLEIHTHRRNLEKGCFSAIALQQKVCTKVVNNNLSKYDEEMVVTLNPDLQVKDHEAVLR